MTDSDGHARHFAVDYYSNAETEQQRTQVIKDLAATPFADEPQVMIEWLFQQNEQRQQNAQQYETFANANMHTMYQQMGYMQHELQSAVFFFNENVTLLKQQVDAMTDKKNLHFWTRNSAVERKALKDDVSMEVLELVQEQISELSSTMRKTLSEDLVNELRDVKDEKQFNEVCSKVSQIKSDVDNRIVAMSAKIELVSKHVIDAKEKVVESKKESKKDKEKLNTEQKMIIGAVDKMKEEQTAKAGQMQHALEKSLSKYKEMRSEMETFKRQFKAEIKAETEKARSDAAEAKEDTAAAKALGETQGRKINAQGLEIEEPKGVLKGQKDAMEVNIGTVTEGVEDVENKGDNVADILLGAEEDLGELKRVKEQIVKELEIMGTFWDTTHLVNVFDMTSSTDASTIFHNVEDGALKVPIAIRSILSYNVTASVVMRSLPKGSIMLESPDKTEPIIIKGGDTTKLLLVLKCNSATPIVPSDEPAFELQCESVIERVVNNMSPGGNTIASNLSHFPVYLKANLVSLKKDFIDLSHLTFDNEGAQSKFIGRYADDLARWTSRYAQNMMQGEMARRSGAGTSTDSMPLGDAEEKPNAPKSARKGAKEPTTPARAKRGLSMFSPGHSARAMRQL